MVKLSSRCPSGWAVGCAQDGRPPAKDAPLKQELQQIPPVQPWKPLLSGWGGGGWKEGRRAEQSCRVWGQSQVSWLPGLALGTGARVSQPPLSFISDLKAVLWPQETNRHSLLSFLQEISLQCLFLKKVFIEFFFYNIVSVPCFGFFVHEAYEIWAPWPRMGPAPPALEGESNHWLPGKFPSNDFSSTSVQGWESGWRKHTASLSLQHPKHEPHSGKASSHLELEVWVDVIWWLSERRRRDQTLYLVPL